MWTNVDKMLVCFMLIFRFHRRHLFEIPLYTVGCGRPERSATANPVWSIHPSRNLTQVRSGQARIQQLDRLLLWTRWFRWGGIASVSAATMAVWSLHQSPPAADCAALRLAFGPQPDSAPTLVLNQYSRPFYQISKRKSVRNNADESLFWQVVQTHRVDMKVSISDTVWQSFFSSWFV